MEIEYVGEHLLPGKIGNLFVVLSFVSSLIAAASYFFSSQNPLDKDSWKNIGRISFRIHSLSVFGIVGVLFYMLFNHYYEYEYVWHHSNSQMPMRYIMSCFWEGQEGSFLLWSFWQVILGNLLIRTSKEWESPVMATISLVQAFLASMLLGVYLFDYRIGSNPFTVLLRETPDFANIPLFKNPNYLQKLDGRGLNPLLQNYWMTIHPPTLFLGFASTIVPFAYAIAGLWKKKFHEWQKSALPWTFFGIMILGTGILMGGAWAYEALSFGGFWAWDPVENASLVPWLTFVGAGHVMLIHKNKGTSLIMSFILPLLTFILILYSTFLTRSGILGETSVHAFTDLGMSGQLLIYLFSFIILSIVLLVINRKNFPKQVEEEALWSREFWMFIGALVLLISSFQIISTTSIPVINKIFGTHKAPPSNVIQHYNTWQIPFAFLVTLIIGIGQFLKYKNTDLKQFIRKISVPVIIAIILTGLIIFGLSLTNYFYGMLLFSSVFCITANSDYFVRILKGNIRKAGPSIAHVGFGLIVLGILISTSKKEIISVNTSGKNVETLGKDFSNNNNILLTSGDTLKMGNYYVSYKGKEKEGINIYFNIEYFTKDPTGKYHYEFTLKPLVQTNPRMGNVAEPDTRHFIHKDIYTHVTYADLSTTEEKNNATNKYSDPKNHIVSVGDTIFSSNSIIVFNSLDTKIDKKQYHLSENDIAAGANLSVFDINNKQYQVKPLYLIKNGQIETIEGIVNELGLKFMFWKINPETGKIEISLSEKKSNASDFIVMEAIIFPYINILWMGCVVMIIGTLIAIRERLKLKQNNAF